MSEKDPDHTRLEKSTWTNGKVIQNKSRTHDMICISFYISFCKFFFFCFFHSFFFFPLSARLFRFILSRNSHKVDLLQQQQISISNHIEVFSFVWWKIQENKLIQRFSEMVKVILDYFICDLRIFRNWMCYCYDLFPSSYALHRPTKCLTNKTITKFSKVMQLSDVELNLLDESP